MIQSGVDAPHSKEWPQQGTYPRDFAVVVRRLVAVVRELDVAGVFGLRVRLGFGLAGVLRSSASGG